MVTKLDNFYLPTWAFSSTGMHYLVKYQALDGLALLVMGFFDYTHLAMR